MYFIYTALYNNPFGVPKWFTAGKHQKVVRTQAQEVLKGTVCKKSSFLSVILNCDVNSSSKNILKHAR